MEITNEIKAKVFAQYLGQRTNVGKLYDIHLDGYYKCEINIENWATGRLDNNQLKLILKPISKITDEDAIEVGKKFGGGSLANGKWIVDSLFRTDESNSFYVIDIILIYQFLKSKGYDLPHYLLNGKTLQECGLAIHE